MIYQWKPKSSIPIDPQAAGERLEALRVHNNGILTPRAVVDDARPEGAVLHDAFEWDDSVAAEKFREDQARYVLRSITVVMQVSEPEAPKPMRAFVSVTQEDQRSYTSVSVALSDADLRQQVLAQAMRDLLAWREKYKELEELSVIFAAIDAGEK